MAVGLLSPKLSLLQPLVYSLLQIKMTLHPSGPPLPRVLAGTLLAMPVALYFAAAGAADPAIQFTQGPIIRAIPGIAAGRQGQAPSPPQSTGQQASGPQGSGQPSSEQARASPQSAAGTRQASASDAYPIEQLVELADRHNSLILASVEALRSSQALIAVASVLPNPRIELGLGVQSLRAALPDTSGRVNSLGVSQLVENPALREARIGASMSLARSQQAQLRGTRTLVAGEVRRLAYEVLLRGEEVQAALDARNLLRQTRERVRLRVESGEAARYELIKADAEVIGAEQRQKVATLALEQARIRLQQLVGVPLVTGWTVAGSLDDPIRVGERSALRARIAQQHPDLLALRALTQAAEQRIREAQASRYPGVDLSLVQSREAPGGQPALRETLFGATLSVPLFDSRRAAVDFARAELRRVEVELLGREQLLLREFDTAWAALDIARARVTSLAEGAVREAEAALRVAEAAYRFGERGILEVIDAQRVLRAVRADLLLAKFEQQSAANTIQVLTEAMTAPMEQRQ